MSNMAGDHDVLRIADGPDRGPLHVMDLPQLHHKPSADALMKALALLAVTAEPWSAASASDQAEITAVEEEGVPQYLTRIVGSTLPWIEDDEARENIWELASQRLTERTGRTGMSALTREFNIPVSDNASRSLTIHEPALTSDNLGLKTWGSAYVLAKKLHSIPVKIRGEQATSPRNPRILEFGAGTGLVGLAAAAVWKTHALMTDLPEIVPNLRGNITLNASLMREVGGSASAAILDWSEPGQTISASHSCGDSYKLSPGEHGFDVIIAADPIYDPSHPRLLVGAMERWIAHSDLFPVTILVAYPIRNAYLPQIHELKELLRKLGAKMIQEEREASMDDWKDEVLVEWSIWER